MSENPGLPKCGCPITLRRWPRGARRAGRCRLADDHRVREQDERPGDQRPEGGHGEPQDFRVVGFRRAGRGQRRRSWPGAGRGAGEEGAGDGMARIVIATIICPQNFRSRSPGSVNGRPAAPRDYPGERGRPGRRGPAHGAGRPVPGQGTGPPARDARAFRAAGHGRRARPEANSHDGPRTAYSRSARMRTAPRIVIARGYSPGPQLQYAISAMAFGILRPWRGRRRSARWDQARAS